MDRNTEMPPMGEEARIAMIEEQAQRDLLGFLNNPCTERLSYYKGRSFIYKMNNQNDQSLTQCPWFCNVKYWKNN